MKALLYVGSDAVAYAPEALETILAGQGMPPTCPIWAESHPGFGANPCRTVLVDVDEAAEVYENLNGKYVPIKEDFKTFKNKKVQEVLDVKKGFKNALLNPKKSTK